MDKWTLGYGYYMQHLLRAYALGNSPLMQHTPRSPRCTAMLWDQSTRTLSCVVKVYALNIPSVMPCASCETSSHTNSASLILSSAPYVKRLFRRYYVWSNKVYEMVLTSLNVQVGTKPPHHNHNRILDYSIQEIC